MERPRIYISIPITGHDEARQRERADLIKARLSREGGHPVSPFEIYVGKNPTYADHICCDLRALADCDAILMCEGWQLSRGCRIERYFALQMEIPAFSENGMQLDAIPQNQRYFMRWLRAGKEAQQ